MTLPICGMYWRLSFFMAVPVVAIHNRLRIELVLVLKKEADKRQRAQFST